MLRSLSLCLLALVSALSAPEALAQAYQCRMPREVQAPRAVTPDGPVRRTAVAGYTLAASWSPDWCKMKGDTRSMQCSRRYGRFGFVLHGLWPEAAKGAPPQWCSTSPQPRAQTLSKHLCMTPSLSLLAHEWAKHGSCMAKTPATYFTVSAILWNSIHWPDADGLSRKKGLTAGDFRDAFLALNSGWRRDAIGLEVNRKGWLREVKLCYGKDFRPKRCPTRQFGPRDGAPLKIWRGL